MHKKSLLMILLVWLTIAARADTAQDKKGYFSLALPAGWKADSQRSLTYKNPDSTKVVSLASFPFEDSKLQIIANTGEDQSKKDGWKNLSQKPTTVGGDKALVVCGEREEGGQVSLLRMILAVHNGHGAVLTLIVRTDAANADALVVKLGSGLQWK